MGSAKGVIVRVLPSSVAVDFVKRIHYSGSAVNNSVLHFGAFLDGKLHGVMSFGPPMDKRKVIGLAVHEDTGEPCLWNEMLELNRMAFDDELPRNSESRCISVAVRLIKKNAPHIRWILSFSDGAQCGDGTIYRASGFKLTGIRENKSLFRFPTGQVIAALTLENDPSGKKSRELCRDMGVEVKYRTRKDWQALGAEPVPGFQLRYILLLDKKFKLNCPELPFSAIDEAGARMYRGQKLQAAEV